MQVPPQSSGVALGQAHVWDAILQVLPVVLLLQSESPQHAELATQVLPHSFGVLPEHTHA